MPDFPSVNNPNFERTSHTTYLMHIGDPDQKRSVHVGQISRFIDFNNQLSTHPFLKDFRSIPLGFDEFSSAWNAGALANEDPRRFCQILETEDNETGFILNIPTETVTLADFHITPQQIGRSSAASPSVARASNTGPTSVSIFVCFFFSIAAYYISFRCPRFLL
jgi:hypothetical protein